MRQDARLADSGDVTMGRCAREDVRAVLARLGISSARRAVPLDSTEEVIVRGGVHGWMDVGMTEPVRIRIGSMEGGSVDELLDVTVERPVLDQFQVEVGRTLEDRVQAGLTGDDREERHLHAVD